MVGGRLTRPVTVAATSMCLQSSREVLVFSMFAMACALRAAILEGELAHSIYVPGLGTILLLANVTKRSQTIAHEAMLRAERARHGSRGRGQGPAPAGPPHDGDAGIAPGA